MNASRWGIGALLVGAAVIAGCGATTSTAPASAVAASAPASIAPSEPPSAAPSATPVPTATPAPTPSPTPEPWKTFVSDRFHYSIEYPPTWIARPGTNKTSDAFDPFDYPHVYVDRVTRSESLNDATAAEIATIKSHFQAKVISNGPIKIAGYGGRSIVFEGVEQDFAVSIHEVILVKSGVAYYLTMFADLSTAAADGVTFETMYRSWKPR